MPRGPLKVNVFAEMERVVPCNRRFLENRIMFFLFGSP
jgi:hypothetical protein